MTILPERFRHIVIEGPIGAGKTSLARRIADATHAGLMLEAPDDNPFLQRFYDKYKASGLEIVGVGEYDPLVSMKNNLEFMKVTFPVVYESESRTDKQNTKHYDYRRSTGDTRNWGSPWYIFLEPAKFEKKGDTLVKKTHVINGEMIEIEGEKFIREKLGLPAVEPKAKSAANDKIEVSRS